MKGMCIITVHNSLSYILLCGVAALRWAEAPGRSGLVASSRHKEFLLTAYFVMPGIRNSVRFRYTQTAIPASAQRVSVGGVMNFGPEA